MHTQALSKGISRPAFRVIETYFAQGVPEGGNNVGDVAAKEEVWEVTGQLLGLALSVACLEALKTAKTGETVVEAWCLITVLHCVLRCAPAASAMQRRIQFFLIPLPNCTACFGAPLAALKTAKTGETVVEAWCLITVLHCVLRCAPASSAMQRRI